MNTSLLARSAYASSANPTRTSRGTEYEAFASITARLKVAESRGRSGFGLLAEALHDNRRLWAILAADVAEAGNGLAPALRAQIFYLAEFTLQHSPKVLSGRASADVLVEINAAVMRGLRPEGAAA